MILNKNYLCIVKPSYYDIIIFFRFLHSKDPKEWTLEKLAESFPVDKRGVKAILKSRPPRTMHSLQLQDKEVRDHG